MKIKTAIIQFNIQEGKTDANMQKAQELLTAAAHEQVDLLVLPEMWNSGFAFTELSSLAQDFNGEVVSLLRETARQFGVFIIGGSFAEKKHGQFYNTCPIINRVGDVVSKYRKVHLFSHYLNEHLYLHAGEEWVLTDYEQDDESIRLGHMICYDLRFPEFARNLALRGARVFTVPAGWPTARISEFEVLCRARAIENRSFLICTNYTDTQNKEYCGNSMIISPFGEILTKMTNEEGYALGEIDTAVLRQPSTFNSIADRRQFLDEIDDNQL